jgi:hypothetical protein
MSALLHMLIGRRIIRWYMNRPVKESSKPTFKGHY